MSAQKQTCGICKKTSFGQMNYLNLCSKCDKDSAVRGKLRVRTIPPPEELFQVPGEALAYPRGMAESQGAPAIYVVEFGDNIQRAAKHKKEICLWCANPLELRKFFNAAREMVAAAALNFHNNEHRLTWFGAESDDRKWSSIGDSILLFKTYLEATLTTIKFGCSYDEGIAAIDPTKFDRNSSSVTVILDRGFCWNRYSDGETICSIIHEFTHIVCKTTDEKLGADDQYGLTKCQELARSNPDKAWKNADNWAYFICEYRSSVTDFHTIDWKYLDSETYATRSPLKKGMPPP